MEVYQLFVGVVSVASGWPPKNGVDDVNHDARPHHAGLSRVSHHRGLGDAHRVLVPRGSHAEHGLDKVADSLKEDQAG